jgi:hypothetical protein
MFPTATCVVFLFLSVTISTTFSGAVIYRKSKFGPNQVGNSNDHVTAENRNHVNSQRGDRMGQQQVSKLWLGILKMYYYEHS